MNCGRKYSLIEAVASQNMTLFRVKCFIGELRNVVYLLVDGMFRPFFIVKDCGGQTLLFPDWKDVLEERVFT